MAGVAAPRSREASMARRQGVSLANRGHLQSVGAYQITLYLVLFKPLDVTRTARVRVMPMMRRVACQRGPACLVLLSPWGFSQELELIQRFT